MKLSHRWRIRLRNEDETLIVSNPIYPKELELLSRYKLYVSVFLVFMIPFAMAIQGYDRSIDVIEESTEVHLSSSAPTIWHDDCSNTSSFPDLAVWYNGAMGSIGSVDGYINATDYGSASGSHGPVYYHTFQPAIAIRDFNWLEAEIELDGSSAMGAAAIMLYDSDYKRIAILDVADSWSADDDAAAYAGWYDVDFVAAYTPKSHPSDTLSEPYHESLRMELNNTGLYGLIPRVGDFKMLDVGDLELDREISYLCVQFRQQDSYNLCHPMRIHDIKMQYVPDDSTISPTYDTSWYHDGSNITGFQQQVTWPHLWPVSEHDWNIGDGDWLSSGSYLYADNITSGSAWHGPTYTYEFPEVFPTSELTNFSVDFSVDNSDPDYLANYFIYLADENGIPTFMVITWCNHAGESRFGYRTQYYRNSSDTMTMWGIYPSIVQTSFSGGLSLSVNETGDVIGDAPGFGEGYLTTIDDPEIRRNVKYLVLQAFQFESYEVFPIQIHEILVEISDRSMILVDGLADFAYEYGTTDNSLTWSATENLVHEYRILKDGVQVDSGNWTGTSMTYDIDGLDLGIYNYTLEAEGYFGQYTVDSVIVEVEDTTNPTISHPLDMVIPLGFDNYSISWDPFDLKPENYNIYQNGTLVSSGIWNGTDVIYNLVSLELGMYVYQIIVFDTSGNSETDTVLVFVLEDPNLFVPLDFTLIISIGGISVIVIVVGLICSKRGQGAPASAGPRYDW